MGNSAHGVATRTTEHATIRAGSLLRHTISSIYSKWAIVVKYSAHKPPVP